MLFDYPNLEQWRISNGGILRGLAPRACLTRLIHAIGGLGKAGNELVKFVREREEGLSPDSSQDALFSSYASKAGVVGDEDVEVTSRFPSPTIKSLEDVTEQAEAEVRNPFLDLLLDPHPSHKPGPQSPSPSQIVKTEVFISPSTSETLPVEQITKELKDYILSLECKQFASALSLQTGLFDSSNENQLGETEEAPVTDPGHVYRAVHSEISRSSSGVTLYSEHNSTFDDHCYFTPAEHSISQTLPPMILSSSSSSSYGSMNRPDLSQEFCETNDVLEDQAHDFTAETEVFKEEFTLPPVTDVSMVPEEPMETAVPIEKQELYQTEGQGQHDKTLFQITQLKPYLDEISNLQNSDHSHPDPTLDPDIDSCSGWNIDIELAQVYQEIRQLNRALKTVLGMEEISKQIVTSPTSSIHNDIAAESLESSSNENCSIDPYAHFQASFANTSHIPRLSRKASSSGSSGYQTYSFNIDYPSVPAKGSQSVIFSSSEDSITSSPIATTAPLQDDLHFRPNIFPAPIQRNYLTSKANWKVIDDDFSSGSSNELNLTLPTSAKSSSGTFPLNGSLSEPRSFYGQTSSRCLTLARVSESSTDFQSNFRKRQQQHQRQVSSANSFSMDEIRSHSHLYENLPYLRESSLKMERRGMGMQEDTHALSITSISSYHKRYYGEFM